MKINASILFQLCSLLVMALFVSACSQGQKVLPNDMSFSEAPGHKVKLNQDVYVKKSNAEAELVKSGSEIIVSDEATLIESPGHVSTLVLPATQKPTEIKLTLRKGPEWASETSKTLASDRVTEILGEVSEIHGLLFVKKPNQALEKITALKEKYPKIGYLDYIHASTLVLMNRRSEAAVLLKAASEKSPEFEPAKKLLRTIASDEVSP